MKTIDTLNSFNVPTTLKTKQMPNPVNTEKTYPQAKTETLEKENPESKVQISNYDFSARLLPDLAGQIEEPKRSWEILITTQQMGLNSPDELLSAQSNLKPETVLKLLA